MRNYLTPIFRELNSGMSSQLWFSVRRTHPDALSDHYTLVFHAPKFCGEGVYYFLFKKVINRIEEDKRIVIYYIEPYGKSIALLIKISD